MLQLLPPEKARQKAQQGRNLTVYVVFVNYNLLWGCDVMKRKLAAFLAILCLLLPAAGCGNDSQQAASSVTQSQLYGVCHNTMQQELNSYIGGLLQLADLAKQEYSPTNARQLSSSLQMFMVSNNLGVLAEITSGGKLPSDLKAKLINSRYDLEPYFTTLELLHSANDILSDIAKQGNKPLSAVQKEWYRSFRKKLISLADEYQWVGNDFERKDYIPVNLQHLDTIRTLNRELKALNSQVKQQ
jgi:hypothetical protein